MNQTLGSRYADQQFANGYLLTDGVAMQEQHAETFHVPPEVLKHHLQIGHFVELRIDSPRFLMHDEDAAACTCPSCNGEMAKPILRHSHPATLVPLPAQQVPSRGWGEDFWVQITGREHQVFEGRIDNPLVEARLHGLRQNHRMLFHSCHVLTIHSSHRADLVGRMSVDELQQLAEWLRSSAES